MPNMSYEAAYHDESDADDEYERSVVTSPTLPVDYESSSPTESDPPSNEHTPTTFTHTTATAVSPTGLITEWGMSQVADFVGSLGLEGYRTYWLKEGINGEVLVALQQANLKDMGIASVGHRLTILKAVYEVKVKQNVAIEEDDYVPLSADANAPDAHATQDDVARIIHQIKLRDDRIKELEMDLRTMKDDLFRISDEQRKLREDSLPMIRMAKNNSQPLPTPDHIDTPMLTTTMSSTPNPNQYQEPPKSAGGIARKHSKKGWFSVTNNKDKIPSPTIHEGTSLDPSAAALAASNHLTSSFNSDTRSSPHLSNQPSPTSPPYNMTSSGSSTRFGSRNDSIPQPTRSMAPYDGPASQSTTHINFPSERDLRERERDRGAPTSVPGLIQRGPAPQRRLDASGGGGGPSPNGYPNSNGSTTTVGGNSNTTATTNTSADDPTGFMKSFRVSMEEPCHKVLPVALKKYHISEDPSQYSLYIVHGDQERCLGMDERPLILFKQLANEGKKPMFMLRKHATPSDGFSHQRVDPSAGGGGGGGGALGGQSGSGAGGGAFGGQGGGGGGGGGSGGGVGAGGGGGGGSSTRGLNVPGGGNSRVQSYASYTQPLPGGVL